MQLVDEKQICEATKQLCTIADDLNLSSESWAIDCGGTAIKRKSTDYFNKRCLEAEDLLTMFMLLDVSRVEATTFVAARMERIPGFRNILQFNRSTDSAVLNMLLRDIVGSITKNVIGSITAQPKRYFDGLTISRQTHSQMLVCRSQTLSVKLSDRCLFQIIS